MHKEVATSVLQRFVRHTSHLTTLEFGVQIRENNSSKNFYTDSLVASTTISTYLVNKIKAQQLVVLCGSLKTNEWPVISSKVNIMGVKYCMLQTTTYVKQNEQNKK